MVDESFHLTANDVRRYDFGNALRGYDKVRVDQFREQVAAEIERLTRVNIDIEAKARGFHEQLRAFRERDKALSEALVSAQQIGAQTRDQAEREAQLIIREARAEGERVLDGARSEIRRLQATIDSLERMRRVHVMQLRGLVQRHLSEIDASEHLMAEWPDPSVVRGDQAASEEAAQGTRAAASDGFAAAAALDSSAPGNPPANKAPTPAWLDASVPE